MKTISIIALEKVIEELLEQEKIAVRKAAQPFRDKIAQVRADLAKLTGEEITRGDIIKPNITYTGAKRGRKPNFLNSLTYPYKGTVLSKLLYVIKEAGRFITIGEIAHSVKVYEPGVDLDTIKLRFGRHIDKYKKQKKVVSYFIGTKRNTVYGLPQWMDFGTPLEARLHDQEALIDRNLSGTIAHTQGSYLVNTPSVLEAGKVIDNYVGLFENSQQGVE